jgi:hypothetical protein
LLVYIHIVWLCTVHTASRQTEYYVFI